MKKIASILLATFLSLSWTLVAYGASAADTENPTDVENLSATGLSGAVKLTWDAATDDVGVDGYKVYYGITSVTKKGQSYDKNEDAGDVTQYTVNNLENGTKYYFSVIAYDVADNESIAWAKEASATPQAGAAASTDKDAPTVTSAEAINKMEVKVVFSEEIVLPEEDPQDAFSIENSDNFEPLAVTAAEMDEEDDANKTVILSTDAQIDKAEYKLTVSFSIKDKAGNQIISGTSDTAIFKGSAEEKEPEDSDKPQVKKLEAIDNTHVGVQFSETVVLKIDPSTNFKINVENDEAKTLDVLGVKLGDDSQGVKNAYAILTTKAQEKVKYVVTAVDVTDEAGNKIDAEKDSAVFEGKEAVAVEPDEPDEPDAPETPAEDKVAPKDVADFLAEAMAQAQKYIVKLTWKNPKDSDSVEQKLYISNDEGETYESSAKIDPDKELYEMKDMEPGNYWVKLTQEDEAGNESEGAVIEVILSETGPEMIGLVLASIGLGRLFRKRRKEKN